VSVLIFSLFRTMATPLHCVGCIGLGDAKRVSLFPNCVSICEQRSLVKWVSWTARVAMFLFRRTALISFHRLFGPFDWSNPKLLDIG
jgi:hypothetical protein